MNEDKLVTKQSLSKLISLIKLRLDRVQNVLRSGKNINIASDNTINTLGYLFNEETSSIALNYFGGVTNTDNPQATGNFSLSCGVKTQATQDCSHAEGSHTTASGYASHAEGSQTTASGGDSHAEGTETIAEGDCSHAEGESTVATGYASHAEGTGTVASGDCSHASGNSTIASAKAQTVVGKYNEEHSSAYFVVGNGTDDIWRSNAFVVDNDSSYINGLSTSIKTLHRDSANDNKLEPILFNNSNYFYAKLAYINRNFVDEINIEVPTDLTESKELKIILEGDAVNSTQFKVNIYNLVSPTTPESIIINKVRTIGNTPLTEDNIQSLSIHGCIVLTLTYINPDLILYKQEITTQS